MTQDEIIEMARQAGFYSHLELYYDKTMLEAFAELVADKQREESAEICLTVRYDPTYKVRESFAQAIRNQGKHD